MRCDYFDAGVCRSCTLMNVGYDVQLADKQAHVADVLAPVAPGVAWEPPQASEESGFRNKAKLVVGGRRGAVTLGILDGDRRGVDLRHCGLHEPGLAEALPRLAGLVDDLGLTPYDVPERRGELKYLLVTHSPADELMVRFVLRSRAELGLVERARDRVGARVVSVNLHPEHKAVLEGDEEVVLSGHGTLPMDTGAGPLGGRVVLPLPPRSFFQTNTAVATALYAQARSWTDGVEGTVWDLYGGVGGFAHHLAGPGREVVGVETSVEAVAAAASVGTPGTTFVADDATAWAARQPAPPDLVVVNPPRRGLGADLAARLESSGARRVLYSSCSVDSLARDLAAMPSLRSHRARLFDMFPQTRHHEVLVDLRRD